MNSVYYVAVYGPGQIGSEGAVQHHEDHPHVISRNARVGLTLFAIYVVLYGGFIFLCVFRSAAMGGAVLWGMNLAIAYGFGLILAALVLALVYMAICSRPVTHGGRSDSKDGPAQ